MDIENMTEEELATIRGDSIPEETPEVEEPAKVEEAPEAEQTEEVEAEPEQAEEGDEEPPKPLMMPKSRYDSVMARLREQERLNQELQAKLQQPQQAPQQAPQQQVDPNTRIDEIDAKLAEAIKDGDADLATKLMRESRMIQQQQIQHALVGTQQNASNATLQQIQYDNILGAAERAIPSINPDSDVYDEGLVTEIAEIADAFERQGKSPAVALERALDLIKPEGWGEAPAAPKPAPRKTDIKRNVEAAKSQPPRMETGGNSDAAGMGNKIDVMKLSESEFEKLTEDQLAKLRGDFA
jgi:hypothetical protein